MAKETKEWLRAEDRLDPYNWRSSQRENRADYEQRQTPAKWAAILTALVMYQNKHNGMSPTDLMLSQGTGLSPGQIQYHLREMEKAGLVKDSKGWPRRLEIIDGVKVQKLAALEIPKEEKVKEADTVDTSQLDAKTAPLTNRGTPRVRTYRGRADFMTRAKQIGEAIVDHYDRYGTPPDGKYLRDRVYGEGFSSGTLSRHTKQMVRRGWLYHKPGYHQDYSLTGLGRAVLFGHQDEVLHTDTRVAVPDKDWPVQDSSPPSPTPRRAVRPTIPRPVPQPQVYAFVEEPSSNLGGVQDIDLVLELNKRGYRVSK